MMFVMIFRVMGLLFFVFVLLGNFVSVVVMFTFIVASCIRAFGGVREFGFWCIYCVLDEMLCFDLECVEYYCVILDWMWGNLFVVCFIGV